MITVCYLVFRGKTTLDDVIRKILPTEIHRFSQVPGHLVRLSLADLQRFDLPLPYQFAPPYDAHGLFVA